MSIGQGSLCDSLLELSLLSFLSNFASKVKNGFTKDSSSHPQGILQDQYLSEANQIMRKHQFDLRQSKTSLTGFIKNALLRYLKLTLNPRTFCSFYSKCIKRYRVGDGKLNIFIIFLFTRVMLDNNQIYFITYLKIKKFIKDLLQKLIEYEILKNIRSKGRRLKQFRSNDYQVLYGHLRLMQIQERNGKFSTIADTIFSFCNDTREFEMGMNKIQRVIKDHPILTAIFEDFD